MTGRRRAGFRALRRAAACVAALFAVAAQAEPPTYIQAGRLLADPESGTVLSARTIVVRDGRIVAIEEGYIGDGRVIDLRDAFVMPGLIDGHVHLLSELGPHEAEAMASRTEADYAIQGVVNAGRTLRAGFTTVADKGSGEGGDAIYALREAIADGRIAGPRILAAGRYVTVAGGAHDLKGFRSDVRAVLRAGIALCDGPDSCRRAARGEIADGADLVKLMVTGGADSRIANGRGQLMTTAEIAAAVDAAHAMGRRVAAHAHAADGVNAALAAGVDTIEHGTFLDAESLRLFAKTGACLFPTLSAAAASADMMRRAGATPERLAHIDRILQSMRDAAGRAHRARVPIAFGSDSWVGPHGGNAREFRLLVEAGLTPIDALRAATTVAARCLGIEADAGRIAPGRSGDIVAYRGDPLSDIGAMDKPVFVMAAGRVAAAARD